MCSWFPRLCRQADGPVESAQTITPNRVSIERTSALPLLNEPVTAKAEAPNIHKVPTLPLDHGEAFHRREKPSKPSASPESSAQLQVDFNSPRLETEDLLNPPVSPRLSAEVLQHYHAAQERTHGKAAHGALKHHPDHHLDHRQESNVSKISMGTQDGVVEFRQHGDGFEPEDAGDDTESVYTAAEESGCPMMRRTVSSNRRVSFAGSIDEGPRKTKRIATGKRRLSQDVCMKKIIDTLYGKVMADPSLHHFFAEADLSSVKRMQGAMMMYAFGGESLAGAEGMPDLREVHLPLIRDHGLTLRHWELWVRHFEETLDELPEIPRHQKEIAMTSIRATRNAFRPLHGSELAASRS